MNLIDLLSHPDSSLPREGEPNLESQLAGMFDKYYVAVSGLTAGDASTKAVLAALGRIRQLGDAILASLGHALDTHPSASIVAMDGGINSVLHEVATLTSVSLTDGNSGPLFRIRTGELSQRFDLRDLFHIPFEHRDRVSTQRFSFPGLPCLYFGRSIFVCWEECGRPELSKVWTSRFVLAPNQTFRVIDFGYRPVLIAAMLQANGLASRSHGPIGAAYAILWPLIAACTIRRRQDEQRGFVQQYVIPQSLLRWLIDRWMQTTDTSQRIDGIRYFSTHVDDPNVSIAGMNYVFPVQSRAPSGFCSTLRTKFLMTAPINWQIATAPLQAPAVPTYNNVTFELSTGWPQPYHGTVFSRVEGVSDQLPRVPVP